MVVNERCTMPACNMIHLVVIASTLSTAQSCTQNELFQMVIGQLAGQFHKSRRVKLSLVCRFEVVRRHKDYYYGMEHHKQDFNSRIWGDLCRLHINKIKQFEVYITMNKFNSNDLTNCLPRRVTSPQHS